MVLQFSSWAKQSVLAQKSTHLSIDIKLSIVKIAKPCNQPHNFPLKECVYLEYTQGCQDMAGIFLGR